MLTHIGLLLSLTKLVHLHSLPNFSIFVLTFKTFELPWQTVFPWATLQNFAFPRNSAFAHKTFALPKNIALTHKNFAFPINSACAHKTWQTLHLLTKMFAFFQQTLHSLTKLLCSSAKLVMEIIWGGGNILYCILLQWATAKFSE